MHPEAGKTEVVDFGDTSTLGRAHEGKILLSPKLFDMGRKAIAVVILEEQFHLESGHSDRTRNFQDFILARLVSIIEDSYGVYL